MGASERVLVVAPNWLGDAVMALPALADLRRGFGAARLTVAARPSVAGIYRLVPGVDEVVSLQWQGRMLDWRPCRLDAARLRAGQFDIAVLMPNSFASAWLVTCAGIPERWGFATDLRGWLLTRRAARPRGSVHQGAYYQHLVRELGLATGPLEPALAVPEGAADAALALVRDRGWDGARPVVVLAPGAAYGTAKRWPAAHFAALATSLVHEGAACVLVGTAADAATTRAVSNGVSPEAAPYVIDLAGATSLETLAGVLVCARACVSNDSGVMHLAAAVGTPVVALFGPTREHETAPLAARGGRVEVVTNPVWCRPCMLRDCPIDHACMTGLAPERVLRSTLIMMRGGRH